MNPATKVVFPGIEYGSTLAVVIQIQRDMGRLEGEVVRTFVQICSHAFVVRADQCIVLIIQNQRRSRLESKFKRQIRTSYKLVP